jgi:hypothetical protein
MINVKELVECELVEETEVLEENVPECPFVRYKSHMT